MDNGIKKVKKSGHGVPFKKNDPRAGRPKGCPNKFTTLKDAFLEAFIGLGGAQGLLKWAQENKRNQALLYQMICKMLPSNVDIGGLVPTDGRLIIEVVKTNGKPADEKK